MIIGFIIGFITAIILICIGSLLYLKKLKIKDFISIKKNLDNTYCYDYICDDHEKNFYYTDEVISKKD